MTIETDSLPISQVQGAMLLDERDMLSSKRRPVRFARVEVDSLKSRLALMGEKMVKILLHDFAHVRNGKNCSILAL